MPSWEVIIYECEDITKKVHQVLPIDDIITHLQKISVHKGKPYCGCLCNPNTTIENNTLIVIHNSFDGREVFEQARETVKNVN